MPKAKRSIWVYKCTRCDHEWLPRTLDADRDPLVCAKCKSPYWNLPRRSEMAKSAKRA